MSCMWCRCSLNPRITGSAWTACWWSTPRRKRRSRACTRAARWRKARYRRSCARRRPRHFSARTDPHDHHMALLTLFEIMEVSSRADLKSDLLQELERQKQVLLSFRNNPEIAEEALASVVRDIEQASAALFSMTGKI